VASRGDGKQQEVALLPTAGPRHAPEIRPVGRFPASQRIRKRAEFQEIQAGGRRVTTPHFVLLLRARERSERVGSARIGLTVSRRVGNSVVRNRAKRLLREAFRATRDLWADDLDVVIIVKRVTPGMGLAQVVTEWQRAERAIRRRAVEARKDLEKRSA